LKPNFGKKRHGRKSKHHKVNEGEEKKEEDLPKLGEEKSSLPP